MAERITSSRLESSSVVVVEEVDSTRNQAFLFTRRVMQYFSAIMFRGCRIVVNHTVCRRSLCTTRTVDDGMPLHGIRVLDLSRVIAGPMCTLALADLGAEIIKIEHSETGDFVRSWPPLLKDPQLSCTFVAMNRNKKSVGVNFQNAEGQGVLRALAEKCDVLLENYVPGVLAKYALDYESLKSIAPRLIYCSLTGYGSEGPYSRRSGVDLIAASMSGHLHLTGPEDGEPCRPGTSSIDIMAGLWAHGAILAALRKCETTRRGCKIDVDLLSTGIAALANTAATYLNCGQQPQRRGTEHESVVPYKAFKTKDGYVTTGAINDAQFQQLSSFLGVPELAEDERFATAAKRVINRRQLLSVISPLFQKCTTKEWCDLLDGTSLPHGPLNDVAEVFEDPHVKAVGMVQEVQHSIAGTLKVLRPVVRSNDFEVPLQPPPSLGEHTDEILKGILDYSDEKIAELRLRRVIK